MAAPGRFLLAPDLHVGGRTRACGNFDALRRPAVDIHAPSLLADDEVDGVLDDTLAMIAQDNVAALSVHGGLSESRVFALLGM